MSEAKLHILHLAFYLKKFQIQCYKHQNVSAVLKEVSQTHQIKAALILVS